MDKNFDWLIQKFGAPVTDQAVTPETIERFRGKLPDRLLEYWQHYGFCTFSKGLFSIVNPDDYEADLEAWAGDTSIVEEDAYYVIARSAFGTLYLWGSKTGYKYEIDPMRGWLTAQDGNQAEIGMGDADGALARFFATRKKAHFDVDGEDGNGLFDAALAKLGPVASDEVFAFEPALAAGGAAELDNIVKRNVHVHLNVLAQFGQREILDRQALTRKAFG